MYLVSVWVLKAGEGEDATVHELFKRGTCPKTFTAHDMILYTPEVYLFNEFDRRPSSKVDHIYIKI